VKEVCLSGDAINKGVFVQALVSGINPDKKPNDAPPKKYHKPLDIQNFILPSVIVSKTLVFL
jgi:hypothetical protein